MAAIAPPPRVEVGRSGKATWLGGAIGVPHAHWLKLRHKVTVTERLNLELGMNYDLHGKLAARTWAALHLELGGGRGALELCPWYFAWCKRVTLQPTERLKVPLALRLGATLDGAPHIEVGVQNKLIALPLAAVLLAAGKQLHVRHKEGGLAFAFVLPNRGRTHGHEGQVHAEVHGNVKRGGPAGVMLDLEELNCVLRAVQQR